MVAIGELAATLGETDALVIFRKAATTRRHDGRDRSTSCAPGLEEYAARAEKRLILPPKPAGVLAAIAGAPTAVIVLVDHAGLERMASLADVWDGILMKVTVRTKVWTYQVSELPAGRSAVETWLYDRGADMTRGSSKWKAGRPGMIR